MNLADYAIRNRFFVLFLTAVLSAMGLYAYVALGKLEDPTFTVKTAAIITPYPGASAEEVEHQVTDIIERKIQEMSELDTLRSLSRPGLSMIFVDLLESIDSDRLPQQWDLLRRKLQDVEVGLPPGVVASLALDEFSDVYGILFAVHGQNVPSQELKEHAKVLQNRLKQVDGVAKVQLIGARQQAIYIDIDEALLASYKLSPTQLMATLNTQNMLLQAGGINAGISRIRVDAAGQFVTLEDIGNLVVRGGQAAAGGEQTLIRLKDVAVIHTGDREPMLSDMRFNGEQAVALAVTPRDGINVVGIGQTLKQEIIYLEQQLPAGVNIDIVAFQPDEVQKSVTNFVTNLAKSMLIVVAVLWVFMGLKSAMVVGASLLITILFTLVFMLGWGIDLQRVSVGAMILALGMLVDNAIVIVDLYRFKLRIGCTRLKAATRSVAQTGWPLLGATVIAAMAFSPVIFSNTESAEFSRSLFQVIASSLLISWLVGMTVTPLLCYLFLDDPSDKTQTQDEETLYSRGYYGRFQRVLEWALSHRAMTLTIVGGLLVMVLLALPRMQVNFMPMSDRPVLFLDYWLPATGQIERTSEDLRQIEKWLQRQNGVVSLATFVGVGAPRFSVTVEPEPLDPAYGQIVINLDRYDRIPELIARGDKYLRTHFPYAEPRFRELKLATKDKFKIEARIEGPDPKVLRQIADQIKAVYTIHPNTQYIRDDWRQAGQRLVPVFDQEKARRVGISRLDLTQAMQRATEGSPVGLFRKGDELLPILARSADFDTPVLERLDSIPVFSTLGYSVPMGQLVEDFKLEFEETMIWRRNRVRAMTVQADVHGETALQVQMAVMPQIEAIELPPGYSLHWAGEYHDLRDTVVDILKQLPKAALVMLLIMVALFNRLGQPLLIMATLPLFVIGVIPCLILTGIPFGLMGLVAAISLSGMMIKNGVVLMDQIELERGNGKPAYQAVVHSVLNRTLAIVIAALTTILGMIPLLTDVLFDQVAATIMGGLTAATLLVLVVLPVLYCMLFNIPAEPATSEALPKESGHHG